jgi:hypothetical protein
LGNSLLSGYNILSNMFFLIRLCQLLNKTMSQEPTFIARG